MEIRQTQMTHQEIVAIELNYNSYCTPKFEIVFETREEAEHAKIV